PCGEGLGVGVAVGGHISRNDNYPPPQPSPTRAGLSHMEKLRPYFTLRDGSDRRGNSVVPHWIRFCSGFDSVAVCRQREGLPSIRANTTRAKPYAIALPTRGRGAHRMRGSVTPNSKESALVRGRPEGERA